MDGHSRSASHTTCEMAHSVPNIYTHTAFLQTGTSAAHAGKATHTVKDANTEPVYMHRPGLLLDVLQHTSTSLF